MKTYRNRKWHLLLLVALLALLGSCGGGGAGISDVAARLDPVPIGGDVGSDSELAIPIDVQDSVLDQYALDLSGNPNDALEDSVYSDIKDASGVIGSQSANTAFASIDQMYSNWSEVQVAAKLAMSSGVSAADTWATVSSQLVETPEYQAHKADRVTSDAGATVEVVPEKVAPVRNSAQTEHPDSVTGFGPDYTLYKFVVSMDEVRPTEMSVATSGVGRFWIITGDFSRNRYQSPNSWGEMVAGSTNSAILNSNEQRNRIVSAAEHPQNPNKFLCYVVADPTCFVQGIDLTVLDKNSDSYFDTFAAAMVGANATLYDPNGGSKGGSGVSWDQDGADSEISWVWVPDGDQTTFFVTPQRDGIDLGMPPADTELHRDDPDNAVNLGDPDPGIIEYSTVGFSLAGAADPVSAGEVEVPILAPTLSGGFNSDTDTVNLSWGSCVGATNYEVWRRIGDAEYGGAPEATVGDVTTYADNDPEISGQQAHYKLRATAPGIDPSEFSEEISINCPNIATNWQVSTVETEVLQYKPALVEGGGQVYADFTGLKYRLGVTETTILEVTDVLQVSAVKQAADDTAAVAFSRPAGVYLATFGDHDNDPETPDGWVVVTVETGVGFGDTALDIEILNGLPAVVYNAGTDIRARRASVAKPNDDGGFSPAHLILEDADSSQVRFLNLLSNVDGGHIPSLVYYAQSSQASMAISAVDANIDQTADWSNGHVVESAAILGLSAKWDGGICHVAYTTESGQVGYKHSDPDDDAILEQGEWIPAYNLVSGQNGQYLAVDVDIYGSSPVVGYSDSSGDVRMAYAVASTPSLSDWEVNGVVVGGDVAVGSFAYLDMNIDGEDISYLFIDEIDQSSFDYHIKLNSGTF